MGFSYKAIDPEEMRAYKLLEPGQGKFKIMEVDDNAISKSSGNPMMVITFKIVDINQRDTLWNMYLIKSNDETQIKTTATKIYNILGAIGRLDLYGQELKAMDLLGCTGECIIKTEKSRNPDYPEDRSCISKFIAIDQTRDAIIAHQEAILNDPLPF